MANVFRLINILMYLSLFVYKNRVTPIITLEIEAISSKNQISFMVSFCNIYMIVVSYQLVLFNTFPLSKTLLILL